MSALFSLIPKWVLAALVVALSATSCKLTWDKNGLALEIEKGKTTIAELKTGHAEVLKTAALNHAAEVEVERAKEQALQVALDTQRKKTNENLAQLASVRDALRVRMASETKTISGIVTASKGSHSAVAVAAASPRVSDGAKFSSEPDPVIDGLISEAYRADQIRLELLGCYKAYEDARASTLPTN